MAVCNSWQAWVKGDYEEVLALPVEYKWGIIPMMRTPLYVKWIEGNEQQIKERTNSFIGFKRIHTCIELPRAKQLQVQTLQLDAEWTASKELLKNVRKAERENPEFVASVDWSTFYSFMQKHHPYKWPAVQQRCMEALFEVSTDKNFGRIVGVKLNNDWAAMQFFVMRRGRAYLIQNVVASQLRSHEPMAFLLYNLLLKWQQESSTTQVNFMGSNNQGVARFNEKFGAQTKTYWESR